MAKKSKKKAQQSSQTAHGTQMPKISPDLFIDDIRIAYLIAVRLLWPQDPSSQGIQGYPSIADAGGAQIPFAGDGQPTTAAPERDTNEGPFVFGLDNHATFEFSAPPGPGILALPPSTASMSTRPAADGLSVPSGSLLAPEYWPAWPDLDDIHYKSPEAWNFFFADMLEVLSGAASSFAEILLRNHAPATESSGTSTPDLGPHAQENQNLISRREPTPAERQAIADFIYTASLPSHAGDAVKPKKARNKALEERNGATIRVQTATHPIPCETCQAAGSPSWHRSKQALKRHKEKHEKEPQACILCGETIDGRGDMPGTHRRGKHCAVHNQLHARGGKTMVEAWAIHWGLQAHEQWGRDGPK